MSNPEDKQLNQPTKEFLKKKMKCTVARVGFSFSAGRLDVLAYSSKERCFHICEGKRARRIASVGHAIGQLIAYMSMIQENGYDFLNRVSKEERLGLSDFASFLENKAIQACFYVVLPMKGKEKLLLAAKLMLKNLGDFGSSIGIFFSNSQKCELLIPAKPISIEIRKFYNREEFLKEVKNGFLQSEYSKGIVFQEGGHPNVIQFKGKGGNPYLHFEVQVKKQKKSDPSISMNIAFDLEFAKAHLEKLRTQKRKRKIQKAMRKTAKILKSKGEDFKFLPKWGKNWSRLFSTYKTNSKKFDQDDVDKTTEKLILLVKYLKPKLDQINWGKIGKKKNNKI